MHCCFAGKRGDLQEAYLLSDSGAPQMESTTGRNRLSYFESSGGTEENLQHPSSVDNNESSSVIYDDYGFHITAREKLAENNYKKLHKESDHSEDIWNNIFLEWSNTSLETKKKYCRKGIPQNLRKFIWQRLLDSHSVHNPSSNLYFELKSKPLASEEISEAIEKDLSRTFPTQIIFEEGGPGDGKEMLRGILYAYANYNVEVGYCQGMNFLAATLLLQIEGEESTFWAFCTLMESPPYRMKSLYEKGFPMLPCYIHALQKLLKDKNKKLFRQLEKHSIAGFHFTISWFLTLFSYKFNFGLISRIWDMFLCEGWKPIFRIALALLLMEKDKILAQMSELDMNIVLNAIEEGKNQDELLKRAQSIKFLTAKMNRYIKEFRQQKS